MRFILPQVYLLLHHIAIAEDFDAGWDDDTDYDDDFVTHEDHEDPADDTDQLHILDKEEMRSLFVDHIDTNKDGFITLEEMEDASQRVASLEARHQIEAEMGNIDKDGDGLLNFEEFMSLYDLSEGGPQGEAREAWVEGNKRSLKDLLTAGDADKDGKLDVDEFVQLLSPPPGSALAKAMMKAEFTYRDMDQDGKLSSSERHVEQSADEVAVDIISDEDFVKYDVDGDGYLSLAEFEEYGRNLIMENSGMRREILEEMDADKDGKISVDELEKLLEEESEYHSIGTHPLVQDWILLLHEGMRHLPDDLAAFEDQDDDGMDEDRIQKDVQYAADLGAEVGFSEEEGASDEVDDIAADDAEEL